MKKTAPLLASLALAALATTLPVRHADAAVPTPTTHEIAIQRAQKAIETAERQICATTTYLVWSVEAHRRYPEATINEDALVKAAEIGPCGKWQDGSNVRFNIIKSSFKLETLAQVEDDYTPEIHTITHALHSTVRDDLCHSLADIYGKQFKGTRAGAFLQQSVITPYFDKACTTKGAWDLPDENLPKREEALQFLMEQLLPMPDKKATKGGRSLLSDDQTPMVG